MRAGNMLPVYSTAAAALSEVAHLAACSHIYPDLPGAARSGIFLSQFLNKAFAAQFFALGGKLLTESGTKIAVQPGGRAGCGRGGSVRWGGGECTRRQASRRQQCAFHSPFEAPGQHDISPIQPPSTCALLPALQRALPRLPTCRLFRTRHSRQRSRCAAPRCRHRRAACRRWWRSGAASCRAAVSWEQSVPFIIYPHHACCRAAA